MLPHGCSYDATHELCEKHGIQCLTTRDPLLFYAKEVTFKIADGSYGVVAEMKGDCTACTLNTEQVSQQTYAKFIAFVLEYMSINARINCFATRKVRHEKTDDFIKLIKGFHVLGVNVQRSNRDNADEYNQVSFILKCTNPYVTRYVTLQKGQIPDDWNHNNVSNYNTVAALYKRYQFKD